MIYIFSAHRAISRVVFLYAGEWTLGVTQHLYSVFDNGKLKLLREKQPVEYSLFISSLYLLSFSFSLVVNVLPVGTMGLGVPENGEALVVGFFSSPESNMHVIPQTGTIIKQQQQKT